ncbi:MAG: hypothetical protein ACYDCE_16175 [Candidatus Acidiferrales bacterium]
MITVQGAQSLGAPLLVGVASGGGVPVQPFPSVQTSGGQVATLGDLTGITPSTGATIPTAALEFAWDGQFWKMVRTPTTYKPQSAVAIAAEATIWTPAAGKSFRLMGGMLASSVVGNVTLRDNTAGTIIAVVPCGVAGVGYPIFGPNASNGKLSAAPNNVLTATGPAGSTLSGTVFGMEE